MPATAFGMGAESDPFRDAPWTDEAARAASAYWAWHKALATPSVPALDGSDLEFFFETQREAVLGGQAPTIVGPEIWSRVRPFARDERARVFLADQIFGAAALAQPVVRFETRVELQHFMDRYVVPHALLLADLCNASREFQRPRIAALGEALFLHSRLVSVREDLEGGRNYFPERELRELGVTTNELATSPPSEAVRKLVWRRIVWIRDALARAMPLTEEIPRPIARYMKHVVMLSLEVLAQIERDDFDVAAFEPGLSRYHRAQAWIQSRFGRTAWH